MNKTAYIQALRSGVKEFERLRRERPWPNMDLSGADLSSCDLKMAQLARIDLHDVDFSNSDLSYSNLAHSNLKGARFFGARLFGANLHKAELEGADFRGATLGGMEEDERICINTGMFKNVRWSKEHLEYFLNILNQNDDWQIIYDIVPSSTASAPTVTG